MSKQPQNTVSAAWLTPDVWNACQISDLREQLDRQTAQTESLQTELRDQKAELKSALAQLTRTQEEKNAVEENFRAKQEEWKAATQKAGESHQAELKKKQSEHRMVQADLAMTKKQLGEAKEASNTAEQSHAQAIEALQAELHSTKEQLAREKQEHSNARESLASREAELAETREEIHEQGGALLEKDWGDMSEAETAAMESLGWTEQTYMGEEGTAAGMEPYIRLWSSTDSQLCDKAWKHVKGVLSDKERAAAKSLGLTWEQFAGEVYNELEFTRKEIETLRERVAAGQEVGDGAVRVGDDAEAIRLAEAVAVTRKTATEAEAKNGQLAADNEELTTENEDLRTENKHLQAENERLETERNLAQSSHKKFEKLFRKKLKECDELTHTNEQLTDTTTRESTAVRKTQQRTNEALMAVKGLDMYRKKHSVSRDRNKELAPGHPRNGERRAAWYESLQEVEEHRRPQADERVIWYTRSAVSLDLSHCFYMWHREVQFEKDKDELRGQLKSMTSARDEAISERSTLASELAELGGDTREQRHERSRAAERKIAALKAELDDLRQENAQLTAQAPAVAAGIAESDDLRRQLATLESRVARQSELESQVASLEVELATARSAVDTQVLPEASIQGRYSELVTQHSELQQRHDELQQKQEQEAERLAREHASSRKHKGLVDALRQQDVDRQRELQNVAQMMREINQCVLHATNHCTSVLVEDNAGQSVPKLRQQIEKVAASLRPAVKRSERRLHSLDEAEKTITGGQWRSPPAGIPEAVTPSRPRRAQPEPQPQPEPEPRVDTSGSSWRTSPTSSGGSRRRSNGSGQRRRRSSGSPSRAHRRSPTERSRRSRTPRRRTPLVEISIMGSGPLGINFGYRDTDTHGMLEVTGIDPNSRMAAVRELRPGMLLAELEGRSAATSSPSQFAEIQRRISERSPDEKCAAFSPIPTPCSPLP